MKYPKLPEVRDDEALHDFAQRYLVLKVAQMRKHWKDTFENFAAGGNIDTSTRDAKVMQSAWNAALDMAADSLVCIADRKSFFVDGEIYYNCTTEQHPGFGKANHVCVATHLATGKQVRAVNALSTHKAMAQARREIEALMLNQSIPVQQPQPQKDELLTKVEQLGMRVVELTETIKRTKEGKDEAVNFLEEVNKQRNDLLELVKVQTTLLQGLQHTQASIFDSHKPDAAPVVFGPQLKQQLKEAYLKGWKKAESYYGMIVCNNSVQAMRGNAEKLYGYLNADESAVYRFSTEMSEKLDIAAKKGRSGWQTCTPQQLSDMLRAEVAKGDPVDVANFCMFLHQTGHNILPAAFDEEAERALFEKTMSSECNMDRHSTGPHKGAYVYRQTNIAWAAWKTVQAKAATQPASGYNDEAKPIV